MLFYSEMILDAVGVNSVCKRTEMQRVDGCASRGLFKQTQSNKLLIYTLIKAL